MHSRKYFWGFSNNEHKEGSKFYCRSEQVGKLTNIEFEIFEKCWSKVFLKRTIFIPFLLTNILPQKVLKVPVTLWHVAVTNFANLRKTNRIRI